jgi:hypothetical protein
VGLQLKIKNEESAATRAIGTSVCPCSDEDGADDPLDLLGFLDERALG